MPQVWVKAIGSADNTIGDFWSDPDWDTECAFPIGRGIGVKVGDLLVYYAAGCQHLFGIVEVISDEFYSPAPHAQKWPRRMMVRPLLHSKKGTPLLTRNHNMGVRIQDYTAPSGRPLSTAIMQKSHIRLGDDEFRRILTALEERL